MNVGDRIAVKIDGIIYSDVISTITYRSARPSRYQPLSWWQRLLRRKPKLIEPAVPDTITINMGARALLSEMNRTNSLKNALERMGLLADVLGIDAPEPVGTINPDGLITTERPE